MATQGLEWEARQSSFCVQHHGNNKEKKICKYPVDGFCKETNTIFQFDGCLFNGHRCELTRDKTVNPVNGRLLSNAQPQTDERNRYLLNRGHQLKVMRECEWKKAIKENQDLKQFVNSMKRPYDNKRRMTQDQIAQVILKAKLFGALEVDISVPDHLMSKFYEMTPMFKNIEVSRGDIGDHMKTYAEERNVMNKSRKCLVASMIGEKIMIISPLRHTSDQNLPSCRIYYSPMFPKTRRTDKRYPPCRRRRSK